MLTRLAELVYVIGRSTERAEGIARMISTYHYSATQLGELDDPFGMHDLIATLGGDDDADGTATFRSTAHRWVTDTANHSSVVSCMRTARENAKRAREVLSLELWETLTAATSSIDMLVATGASYEVIAERVPTFTRSFAGVVDTTTPRDEVWEIMRFGTMLERVAMTVRALHIGAEAAGRLPSGDPLALHAWAQTLRACAALDAYRRTSIAVPEGPEVTALLLYSKTCPRSVNFALQAARAVAPASSPAATEIDRARELLITNVTEGGLTALADDLLDACDRIHDALVGGWREAWQ